MTTITKQETHQAPAPPREFLTTPLQKWGGLVLGLLLILVFMFVVLPWVNNTAAVRPLVQFVEDTGINASGLFYTDVEESADAEAQMRDTMRFMPQKQ